jgi:hypothetical protein
MSALMLHFLLDVIKLCFILGIALFIGVVVYVLTIISTIAIIAGSYENRLRSKQ